MPRLVFIPWDVLSKRLPIQYLIPSDAAIKANARRQAAEWMEMFERRSDVELTETERAEIDAVFSGLVTAHWAPAKVFAENLDVKSLVDMLNVWSHKPSSGASERRLPEGDAVFSYSIKDKGITFELMLPFITALVEAKHCAYSVCDEGRSLKDVTSEDVLTTIRNIFECEGRDLITLDLMHWDYAMTLPQYSELETMIQALRTTKLGEPDERTSP